MTAMRIARGSVFIALLLTLSISLTGCTPADVIAIIGAVASGVSQILNGVTGIVSAAKGNAPDNATTTGGANTQNTANTQNQPTANTVLPPDAQP